MKYEIKKLNETKNNFLNKAVCTINRQSVVE